jgi:cytoplasmic iron level regulating protein YaaA (DUF328/UPF0246 family)
MYRGTLFRYAMKYAKKYQKADKIFILSAKYGLLKPNKVINPYDMTLNGFGIEARRKWAKEVRNDLYKKVNLHTGMFVILAGTKYNEFLLPSLKHYTLPLKGLKQGQQIKYLKGCVEGSKRTK